MGKEMGEKEFGKKENKRSQARFFGPCSCCCLVAKSRLFVTPWTIAHQAPMSMVFPRLTRILEWVAIPFSLVHRVHLKN